MRTFLYALCALFPSLSSAQVAVHPSSVEPAAWERFALRVVNQHDTPVITVRLEVPEALTILGTQAPEGWAFHVEPATDTTPQAVTWTGGSVATGGFDEFAVLARLQGDARRKSLVFPVTLTRADGTTLRWGAEPGAAAPPRVQIRGSTFITSWGAAALAGAAFGLSALALALAVFRGRSDEGRGVEASRR